MADLLLEKEKRKKVGLKWIFSALSSVEKISLLN